MLNRHSSPTNQDLRELWQDFGVHNSNELEDKLLSDNEWCTAKCHHCGCKYNLLFCDYASDTNPICPECGR